MISMLTAKAGNKVNFEQHHIKKEEKKVRGKGNIYNRLFSVNSPILSSACCFWSLSKTQQIDLSNLEERKKATESEISKNNLLYTLNGASFCAREYSL